MKHSRYIKLLILSIAAGLLFLASQSPVAAVISPPSAEKEINDAWHNAQNIGVYHYNTTILQTSWPTENLANAGRSSTQQRFYLEGETSRPEDMMRMKLWSGDGNVQQGEGAIEIKVQGDQSYGRVSDTQEWEEIDDITNLFAPDNDHLTYLTAAENVIQAGQETRVGINFTRYTFDINGPRYADYMRTQMENELRRKGELPSDVNLAMSDTYTDMKASGELWVDANGLPLRQIMYLEFPPQQGAMEWAEVKITNDFSQWGTLETNVLGLHVGEGDLGQFLVHTLNSFSIPQDSLASLALLLLMSSFMIAVVKKHESRFMYATVVLLVTASMLATPLLHSNQLYAFSEKQAAQASEYEQEQENREIEREAQEEFSHSDFNPSSDPLTQAPSSQSGTQIASALTHTQPERINLLTNADPTADTDGDGLLDTVETNDLGTNPLNADTDGDYISDGAEVRGFQDTSGKFWYLDPLNADSNGDGRSDMIECPALQDIDLANGQAIVTSPSGNTCQDTDGDGDADVFDFDDDNDGVPDKIDAAPTSVIGRDGISKFSFSVDSTTPGKPLLVDFQLRPTNPDHLWYTMNVLDWPTDDRDGQVKRVFDNTLGEVNQSDAASNSYNGDMRLTPMMEIEIPYQAGGYGNLPVKLEYSGEITASTPVAMWLDSTQTDIFGISIKKKDEQGTLLAYVPLALTRDTVGDSPAAFSGRMFYRPSGDDWGKNHEIRLVWMVQMLNDYCDTSDIPEGGSYTEWCAGTTHWKTNMSVVQTYYDDWSLTGLSVREDHGIEAGFIFEDPDVATIAPDYNSDTYYEGHLLGLADSLGKSFVAGRVNSNGDRDLTLNDVAARFDSRQNGGVSETERWGMPQDTFMVETFDIEHQGLLGMIPMTYTKQILNDYFTTGNQAKIDAPALLFAREETYRSVSLDSGIQNGNRYVASLDGVDRDVLASMQLMTYQYQDTGAWNAYPLDEYWADHLEGRLEAPFQQKWGNADAAAGALIVTRAIYTSLSYGLTSIVQSGDTALSLPEATSDTSLEDITDNSLDKGDWAAEKVESTLDKIGQARDMWKQGGQTFDGTVGELKKLAQGGWKDAKEFFSIESNTKMGLLVVGVVVIVGVIAYILQTKGVLGDVLKVGQDLLGIGLAAYAVYNAAVELGKNAVEKVAESVSRASEYAAVIGLVIGIAVSIGFFVYAMIEKGVEFGSLAFNAALAGLAATIIVQLIMFAIGLIPVIGALIVVIIALVDILITSICKWTGANESDNWWAKKFCGGISSAVGKLVQYLIYSSNPIVDIQASDRLLPSNWDTSLVNPEMGYMVGNRLNIEADVTTALYRNKPNSPLAYAIGTEDYKDIYLRDATFRYTFVMSKGIELEPVALQQMYTEWQPLHDDGWGGVQESWDIISNSNTRRFTTTQHINNSGEYRFTSPGVNRPISPTFLAEHYIIPVQQCAGLLVLGHCWRQDKTDSIYIDMGTRFTFDIFPSSIGWLSSMNWDEILPVQQDADGDGLRSKEHGGPDPNDFNPDSDGDGLSDFWELQNGYDPLQADGDNDGLNDYWEVFYNTNARQADSDYDGLSDKEEIDGWEYVYAFDDNNNPLTTWVTSDPNDRDPDNDTLTDALEKAYGFHPRIASQLDFLSLESQVSDNLVAPGQTVQYTATIKNELRSRYAVGLLEAALPAAAESPDDLRQTYILNPWQQATLTGSVTIQPGTPSQAISMTNLAGAEITDLRAAADGREVWLHLDEQAGFNRFTDSAMNGHNGSCRTPYCPTAGEQGYAGQALHFDGVDDWVQLDGDVSLENASFTVAAWAKRDSVGSDATIIEHGTSGYWGERMLFGFKYDDNSGENTFVCNIDSYYYDDLETPSGTDLEWHHWACTYDTENRIRTIYRDGTAVISDTLGAGASFGTGGFSIGRRGDVSNPAYFNGAIDEVEIYPRTLTPAEIMAKNIGLRLHLDFENGRYADTSSLKNSITCDTCPSLASGGEVGDYATFDGDTAYQASGQGINLPDGQFSYAFWLYPPYLANYYDRLADNYIIGNGHETGPYSHEFYYPTLYIEGSSNDLALSLGCPSSFEISFGSDTVDTSEWQHVIVTSGDNGSILYINGQEKGSSNYACGSVAETEQPFLIGNGLEDGGKLDEVQIYNYALDAQEAADIYSDQILLHLPFDELPGQNNFRSDTGSQAAACLNDTTCPDSGLPGRLNQALRFDGQDDYLVLGGANSLGLQESDFTVSVWVKSADWSGDHAILGTDEIDPALSLSLGVRNSTPYFKLGNQELLGNSILNPNQWYHLTWKYNDYDDEQVIVVNGSLDNSQRNVSAFQGTGTVMVGRSGGGNLFAGLIDELSIRRYYVYGDTGEMEQVPALNLHLDESLGATAFGDDSHNVFSVSCSGSACPNAGAKGQMRQALSFDGDDYVSLPTLEELGVQKSSNGQPPYLSDFTITAWVNARDINGSRPIFSAVDSSNQLLLGIQDGKAVFSTQEHGTMYSAATLSPNQWVHLAWSYDAGRGRHAIFVNGIRDKQIEDAWIRDWANQPVMLGSAGANYFVGKLDEVALYNRELSDEEIKSLYESQIRWVDVSNDHAIVVDGEAPAVVLQSGDGYLQNTDIILTIEATDITSGIAAVEYNIDGAGWHSATQDRNAWVFRFNPDHNLSEGQHTVQVRAIDLVGNQAESTSHVTIDDAPPAFTLAVDTNIVQPAPHNETTNRWHLGLSGTVNDAGSGAATLQVSIFDYAGQSVGASQFINLENSSWEMVYPFNFAPNGAYQTQFMVTDNVGNSSRFTETIKVDGIAPVASIITPIIAGNVITTTNTVITGTVSDIPYLPNAELMLHLEGNVPSQFYDSSAFKYDGTCTPPDCPIRQAGKYGQGLSFDGSDDSITISSGPVITFTQDPAITLAAWVKPDGGASSQSLFYAELGGDSALQIQLNGNDLNGTLTFSDTLRQVITGTVINGQWNHVALVYDGASVRTYIDGLQTAVWKKTDAADIFIGLDQLWLGSHAGASAFYAGELDEIVLYNRSLNADQIHELANPAISGVAALDVGFLHFGSDEQPMWYPAVLAQPGQAISTWSIQIPEGIEGPQQIHLRPADAFNNSRVLPNVLSVDIDTQAPRIELYQTWVGSNLRYTTVITDYNLTEENFNSPCGIGVISTQKTLTETWYTDLYGVDAPSRPYQFTAECELSYAPTLSEASAYDTPNYASGAAVNGNYAYITNDSQGLQIVDISDPTAPILTGSYDAQGYAAHGVAVSGTYAYIAGGGLGLQVINVSDPANPSLAGSYDTTGYAKDVVVSGNYAYLADNWSGLQIVDISDPANPVLTATYNTPRTANGVAVDGNYVYVADEFSGLLIVNVSDPANPVLAGTHDTPASANSVAVDGNYAYVADNYSGLQIVDISDPANPVLTGTHDTPDDAMGVAVAGNYVYVAARTSGLQMVNISDPANPSLADAYDTPDYAVDVVVVGKYVYVVDDSYGLRIVDTSLPSGAQATACDAFGHCDTVVPSVTLAAQFSQAAAEPEIATWIDAPRLLLDTMPITMTGSVQGQQASLKAVTVTVDSQIIYSQTWSSGIITETVIDALWTPSGEGKHDVTLSATDWLTGTGLYTATITLDTLPPTVTLDKNVWNAQDYNRLNQIILSGGVQDANEIIRLDASAKSATMSEPITLLTEFEDAEWKAFLPAEDLNGITYTLVLTATDIAYRETVFSDIITVDTIYPPEPQNLTLGYQNVTSYTHIIPGDTIRDVLSPTLTLTWTVATNSDAVGYTVEWLNQISSTYQLLQTDAIPGIGPFTSSFNAAELQKIYARLTTRDVYNNIITQTVGPFYMDYYLTPAYVDMGANEASGQPYRAWLDESCNLLGADLRLDERANELAALDSPQNLYASWDDAGLRLTWTGANWDIDGDLFIYLDSQGGGSNLTYNPYPISGTLNITNEQDIVMLPFEADYAVWVHDSQEAKLLTWQGDNWTVISSTFQYVFDANQITPYTDLYIPFTSIGIVQPSDTSLSMLAFAAEEGGLYLWSALPARSNLNSELIGAVSMEDGQYFKLTQSYDWLSLNDNICPTVIQTSATQLHALNAGASTTQGADVRASIQTDQPGIAYGIYQDNLYMLQDRQFDLAESPNPRAEMCARYPAMIGCAGEPQPPGTPIMYNVLFDPQPFKDLDAVMSVRPGVLGMGDVITYNLTIRNQGTLTATGIQVRASGGEGPIILPDASWYCGSLDIDVGDLAPGETRTVTFNGRIDDEQFCFAWLEGWARMNVTVKDDLGTIDWMNIEHRIDNRAPHRVEIESPQALIKLGENIIQGFVADETGVPTITLQVVTNMTSTFTCEDETPDDGAWSCPVNVSGAVEGDNVQLRVRATDEWGHQTDWFTDDLLVVDSTPPTVTLSLATETALRDQRMGGNETYLQGNLSDNYLLDSVEVCEGAVCEQAELLQDSPLGRGTFTYDDEPDAPLGLIGFSTDCVLGTPITRPFTVTEEFVVDDVDFGLTLEHNRRNDTSISLHSPAGTVASLGIGVFGAGRDNIDVLFDDLSPLRVQDDPFRHDVSTPYYENKFAPTYGNLDAFHGESAQGVWQLSICDLDMNNGSEEDNGYGVYHRSQLILTPKTEVVTDTAASWAYNMVLPADIDGGPTRTLHIYGLDNAGNRSEPLTLTFDIDTAAPVITDVLETYQEVWHRGSPFEISGRVLDSSPIHTLQLQLMDPAGNISADNIHLVGDTWHYTDSTLFAQLGDYLIWIEAQDDAGNSSSLGPLALRVVASDRYDSYLPLIFKDGLAIR